MINLKAMLRDESGGASVDFVVLTAAAVTLAMLVGPMVVTEVSDVASVIGETILRYGDYIDR
jgi:Flp pilus assembly pilin Flp